MHTQKNRVNAETNTKTNTMAVIVAADGRAGTHLSERPLAR